MNEKGAVALASTFALCPVQLQARTDNAFAGLATSNGLVHAVEILEELLRETEAFVSNRQVSDG